MTTLLSIAPPPPPPTSLTRRLSLLSSTTSHFAPRHANNRAQPPSLLCAVAVRSDSSLSISNSDDDDEEEVKSKLEKVGSKVKVKAPMKVYHVPRVHEVELTPEMEGIVKQYVGVWKGKRITATYPFKVEYTIDVEGRGKVKFVAHLREEEFDFVE